MENMPSWRKLVGSSIRPLLEFDVTPRTTALLIIDMQNFCSRDDADLGKSVKTHHPEIANYFFPRVKDIVIPNNKKLVDFFRANKLRIVYTRVGPILPDASDLFPRRRVGHVGKPTKDLTPTHFPHYPLGTWEHDIINELKPLKNELIIDKTSSGAFNSTGIDQLLRNMGVESLVITGISTNHCVETTARDAADRGYWCIMVNDGCATFSQLFHDVTMANFQRIFGLVMDTDEIIANFSKKLNLG